MPEPLPIIKIKAQANHHALFLIVLGLTLFMVLLIIAQWYWRQFQLVMVFAYLTSLVITIAGVVKRLEPQFSFSLTPDHITYHHRYGQWRLHWQQIHRISIVSETVALEHIQLPYIGIKLVNIEQLLAQISPRMANRLIHEQKPLISFAIRYQLMALKQGILHFEPYKLSDGTTISGPLAAFLYHCQALDAAFGYHLFIPATSVDRDLPQFSALLLDCKRASAHYQSNTDATDSNTDDNGTDEK
ncbi:DUF2982 domain-containing protein [Colwellia asteriadis]